MSAALVSAAAPARAQYPLTPSPVLAIGTLEPHPGFSGYIAVRDAVRNDSSTFTVNRARLTVMTAPLPYIAIRLQGDFSSALSGKAESDGTVHGFTLTDAYVQIASPHPEAGSALATLHPALLVGQFKQPFSLEYLTPFAGLLTANRSFAVDELAPKRDIGILAQAGWSRFVTLAASVTNGEGANALSNPTGRQFAIGRLTLTPFPGLAIAGKLADDGPDHLRGYDGRWIWRGLVVEGEAVHRTHPVGADAYLDAGGGYVAAAYRVFPWLQPVYKQEWYSTTSTSAVGSVGTRSAWSTIGATVLAPRGIVRLDLDWTRKAERPVSLHDNELDAQLIAVF